MDQAIGRELFRGLKATEAPNVLERMLKTYLDRRDSPDVSFNDFVRKHSTDTLKRWFNAEADYPLGVAAS